MFGTLESLIQDLRLATGDHSIEYECAAVPRKQRQTGCHSLVLVGLRQCVGYPLSQFVRLPYALQVKSDCFIRNLEAFGKLCTRLIAVLLFCRLQDLVIQGIWTPAAGFITQGQIIRPEFRELMSGGAFIYSIIPKSLTYSETLIWLRTRPL